MLLKAKDFKKIFAAWSKVMTEKMDYLVTLDQVAGDGDLGLTMSDGFGAMDAYESKADDDADLGQLFFTAGKEMNIHASSSLGTLISSGFMEAGKAFKGQNSMSGCELAKLLEAVEAGIVKRGKAAVGEKTFLDGFHPAVEIMNANTDEEKVLLTLREAASAAQQGSASTVGMLAKWGRAARRGEDSRQILDPGSVVAALIVSTLSDTVNAEDFQ